MDSSSDSSPARVGYRVDGCAWAVILFAPCPCNSPLPPSPPSIQGFLATMPWSLLLTMTLASSPSLEHSIEKPSQDTLSLFLCVCDGLVLAVVTCPPLLEQAYEQDYHPSASSSATLVVDVIDVNEPPAFSSSHYSTALPEGAGPGQPLSLGLQALDADEVQGLAWQATSVTQLPGSCSFPPPPPQGRNAELTYSIGLIEALQTANGTTVAIPDPVFFIDPASGAIFLNTSLEREHAVTGFRYYEITVSGCRCVGVWVWVWVCGCGCVSVLLGPSLPRLQSKVVGQLAYPHLAYT